MEATDNQITQPNLFTALRYRQIDLDFGPEHPASDDSEQVDDEGHIPYGDDDDLEKCPARSRGGD